MSLLRTFIAVDIPSHIQQAIHQTTQSLRANLGSSIVRWVDASNIHLTIKFIGDVSPARLDFLIQALRLEASSIHTFDIRVGGLGSFPNLRRSRVLWVGVQAGAELEALYRGIDVSCARLGYESEARGFHPHLTIGRVRQGVTPIEQEKIRRGLEDIHIDSLGSARVDSAHLYKSDLQPSGAMYTKLYSAPLKKRQLSNSAAL